MQDADRIADELRHDRRRRTGQTGADVQSNNGFEVMSSLSGKRRVGTARSQDAHANAYAANRPATLVALD